MSQFTILLEVDRGFYRIIETYPTSDGIRSRICDWRNKSQEATREEIERRIEARNK